MNLNLKVTVGWSESRSLLSLAFQCFTYNLFILWRSLQKNNVKFPSLRFYRQREHTAVNVSFSIRVRQKFCDSQVFWTSVRKKPKSACPKHFKQRRNKTSIKCAACSTQFRRLGTETNRKAFHGCSLLRTETKHDFKALKFVGLFKLLLLSKEPSFFHEWIN